MSDKQHRLAKRYEELRQFLSFDQADQAVKQCERQLCRTPSFWLGFVGLACIVSITIAATLIGFNRWLDMPKNIYGVLTGAITAAATIEAMTWFWRRRFRLFLRQKLVAYGVPVCLTCGHDLRGQMQPRCPECGTQFDSDLVDLNHEHLA